MKRLALLALLLASSSLVAAPAPVPKTQRKAERPPARLFDMALRINDEKIIRNWRVVRRQAAAFPVQGVVFPVPVQAPAQPPNADPPG